MAHGIFVQHVGSFFFSCCVQTLFCWPGIEPWPSTLGGVWSLNHWTIKEVPQSRLSDTEKYISQTERFVPNSNQNKHISTGFQSFFFPQNQISNRKLCSLFYSLINMVYDTCGHVPGSLTRGLTVRLPESWQTFITMSNDWVWLPQFQYNSLLLIIAVFFYTCSYHFEFGWPWKGNFMDLILCFTQKKVILRSKHDGFSHFVEAN